MGENELGDVFLCEGTIRAPWDFRNFAVYHSELIEPLPFFSKTLTTWYPIPVSDAAANFVTHCSESLITISSLSGRAALHGDSSLGAPPNSLVAFQEAQEIATSLTLRRELSQTELLTLF